MNTPTRPKAKMEEQSGHKPTNGPCPREAGECGCVNCASTCACRQAEARPCGGERAKRGSWR